MLAMALWACNPIHEFSRESPVTPEVKKTGLCICGMEEVLALKRHWFWPCSGHSCCIVPEPKGIRASGMASTRVPPLQFPRRVFSLKTLKTGTNK